MVLAIYKLSETLCDISDMLATAFPGGFCNQMHVTTKTEHVRSTNRSRVIIVSMLSPQLLIPPHSVQAEASGGTVEHKRLRDGPPKL